MNDSPFSSSTITLITAALVALVALSFILHAFEPEGVTGSYPRSSPSSYSTSAVGHAGFYETLKNLGRPVNRSLGNTGSLLGDQGTLVVIEPLARLVKESGRAFNKADRVLVVLPKRLPRRDVNKPQWVSGADIIPPKYLPFAPQEVLNLVEPGAEVVRAEWPKAWETNVFDIQPGVVDSEVQLIRSGELTPLVADKSGILLGEIIKNGRKIWVLSDPDILANLGLTKDKNAAFMVALVDELRLWQNSNSQAPIVFDETFHGLTGAEGSPLKLLFRFPYVMVVLLAALAALAAALAGAGRFGAPLKPEVQLDFGKSGLINNSVRLLDFAGHRAMTLKNYVTMTIRTVARELHAPRNLTDAELYRWLDRLGRARGSEASVEEIAGQAMAVSDQDIKNLPRLYLCVRAIHKWKGEMLDGSVSRRRHN